MARSLRDELDAILDILRQLAVRINMVESEVKEDRKKQRRLDTEPTPVSSAVRQYDAIANHHALVLAANAAIGCGQRALDEDGINSALFERLRELGVAVDACEESGPPPWRASRDA